MENRRNQDEIATVKIEDEADTPRLTMTGMSIIGTREYQQDTYYLMATQRGTLAVICDGMGGMEHGEIASMTAVEKIAGDFELWEQEESPAAFLNREAFAMDRQVAQITDESGRKLAAGTTVVCAMTEGNSLYWLSVGDSRIYVFREGQMLCVTRDHNYGFRLQRQLEAGSITEEEYNSKKEQSEALVSYLGMDGLEMIDCNREPFLLEEGDRILLCSDGLYKCLPEDRIFDILQEKGMRGKQVVEKLLNEVEESPKRNKDNTTAVLLEYR